MEYSSQLELYKALLPVFDVKKRLLKYYNYSDITSNDIWKYLSINKWKHTNNLTISEIVNDILLINPIDIIKFRGA